MSGLRQGFEDCWKLCDTLQSMSALYREELYSKSHNPETARTIFTLCWSLCKAIKENQSDTPTHLDHLLQTARDLEHAVSDRLMPLPVPPWS